MKHFLLAVLLLTGSYGFSQWTTVNLVNFNSLTYESAYTTNGNSYWANTANPSTGPRNSIINGTWEVSNTNIGATQSPSNASGGRFLMYWSDNLCSCTSVAGTVWSKTYTGLTIGNQYRYSFKYGYLVIAPGGVLSSPTLSVYRDGVQVQTLPAATTSWQTTSYYTFTATSSTHTISIQNASTVVNGNDFALDDILLETFTPGAPMPVTLHSFSGNLMQDGRVRLFWEVSNEDKFNRYEIQHSTNGTDFTDLGNVKAANKSAYTFFHNTPVPGRNYYRLKLVDMDGKFSFSNIIIVTAAKNDKDVLLFPNPVKNQATLSVPGKYMTTPASVYDNTGRKVMSFIITRSDFLLDCSTLQKGVYFIRLSDNELVRMLKL